MNIGHYKQFKDEVLKVLNNSISEDYSGYILTEIIGDVIEDIESCADDNYNEDDIRLAIGRSLMKNLDLIIDN